METAWSNLSESDPVLVVNNGSVGNVEEAYPCNGATAEEQETYDRLVYLLEGVGQVILCIRL